MRKTKKLYAVALSGMIIAGVLFVVMKREPFIDQQTAIESARMACLRDADQEAEGPRVVTARLVHCEDPVEPADHDFCYARSSVATWYIEMDGRWWFFGPPYEDGTESPPDSATYCYVYVDAKTGDTIRLGMDY